MKLFSPAFLATRLAAGAFVLVSLASSVSIVSAQENRRATPPAQRSNDPAARAAEAATQEQAFNEAARSFRGKNVVQGEQWLFSTNRSQSGTLSWYLEAAGKLTQMALLLRQEYDYPGALALAQRALVFLNQAEPLARRADARQQGALFQMTGFLHDELLRDSDSAKAAYEKAQRANPKSKRAAEELARLEEEKTKNERLAKQR